MTIDWDKPIETTDGELARVISRSYRSRKRKDTNIVVQIEYDGFNEIHFYTEDGSTVYLTSPHLRNKTKKVTRWYNLYADGPGVGGYYTSEGEAVRHKSCSRVYLRTCSIEIEVPCD